jgi:hypothetical protein
MTTDILLDRFDHALEHHHFSTGLCSNLLDSDRVEIVLDYPNAIRFTQIFAPHLVHPTSRPVSSTGSWLFAPVDPDDRPVEVLGMLERPVSIQIPYPEAEVILSYLESSIVASQDGFRGFVAGVPLEN